MNKTIADLKINWTFSRDDGKDLGYFDRLFAKLNPTISNLKIIVNTYKFHFYDLVLIVYSYNSESLKSFISYLNYLMWNVNFRDVVLDHFEKISETEYRIIEKK